MASTPSELLSEINRAENNENKRHIVENNVKELVIARNKLVEKRMGMSLLAFKELLIRCQPQKSHFDGDTGKYVSVYHDTIIIVNHLLGRIRFRIVQIRPDRENFCYSCSQNIRALFTLFDDSYLNDFFETRFGITWEIVPINKEHVCLYPEEDDKIVWPYEKEEKAEKMDVI